MLHKSYTDSYKAPSKGIHQADPKSQPIIGAVVQFYYFIVGAGAVPVRLLIRKDIGERSLTPMTCIVSLGLHIWYVYEYILLVGIGGAYLFFGNIDFKVGLGWNLETGILVLVFLFNGFNLYLFDVFFFRAKSHFRKIVQKAKENRISKSSYFRGKSIYFDNLIGGDIKTVFGSFKIDEDILRMIVEPRKVFYAGLKITLVSILLSFIISYFCTSFYLKCLGLYIFTFSSVGIIIFLSAICLFLEEFGLSNRVRNAALDLEDAPRDLKLIMDKKKKFITVEEKDGKLLL